MEDVFKSVKAYLYDRSVSPLLGGFILSWLIWNYQFVLVVLSSESVLFKLNIIESIYSSSFAPFGSMIEVPVYFSIGLVAPLLTMIFFIYVVPFFSIPVYRQSLETRKKLDETKLKYHEGRILTYAESRQITAMIYQSRLEHEEQVKKLEDDNKKLAETIDQMSSLRPDDSKMLLEKAYSYLLSQLIRLPGGSEFAVSDLLKGFDEAYSSYVTVETMEERFYLAVTSGQFNNITLDSDKPAGTHRYHLSFWENKIDLLSPDEEVVLNHFVREELDSISAPTLESDLSSNLNIYKIKIALNQLVSKQYLARNTHANSSVTYDLLDAARMYIVAKDWV